MLLSTIQRQLALGYLTTSDANRKLPDPVAMFHLSNGASLERLNTDANKMPQGIASSCGVMVNYLYDLQPVEIKQIRISTSPPRNL